MENLHLVFCVTIKFLMVTRLDICMVDNCSEVVIARIQLEGCVIRGVEFQGAALAFV